jgi:hypothetical protein
VKNKAVQGEERRIKKEQEKNNDRNKHGMLERKINELKRIENLNYMDPCLKRKIFSSPGILLW